MESEDLKKWEQDCIIIRAENKILLANFQEWLESKNLANATINGHIDNVSLYIDDYLLYYDAERATEKEDLIGFATWYNRKVMWGTAKKAISSCKKFYKFLYESKLISQERYEWARTFKLEEEDDDDYSFPYFG